ncbi:MAG: thioredoxin [Phycisphaerales bacterium]|nr:thioredoxin [Phycisphaerales bacterium]
MNDPTLARPRRAPRSTAVSTSSATLHLDDKTFTSSTSGGVALVDFWAPWCPPCRMLGPTIDAIADEYAGRATIAKINVDESPTVAGSFGVQSIPTMVLMKNGKEVGRFVGVRSKGDIAAALDKLLD